MVSRYEHKYNRKEKKKRKRRKCLQLENCGSKCVETSLWETDIQQGDSKTIQEPSNSLLAAEVRDPSFWEANVRTVTKARFTGG